MIQQKESSHPQQQKPQEQKKEKKKLSLLKKKTKSTVWNQLYQNVDMKHILNINDIVFINQNALKDPQNKQSLLSAIFYYKMISKVGINQDNIVITLKKLDENALPPQYYLERLRSYGDKKYYNIANYLENLKKQFAHFEQFQKQKSTFKTQNFQFNEQIKILHDAVNKRIGKMYLIFFSQIYPAGVMLKKIIISSALLKQLGYNVNQIALDFIKHKHIFFEYLYIISYLYSYRIFTAKMYSTMIQSSLRRYSQITSLLMQNSSQSCNYQDFQQQSQIIYNDQMIKRKQINGSYQEELLSVRVKWTSIHPSVGIFDIDEVKEINVPYNGGNKKIKKLLLPDIQGELKSLQHLTKIDPSLLEQNKNRCCTFKMINQEKIIEDNQKQ